MVEELDKSWFKMPFYHVRIMHKKPEALIPTTGYELDLSDEDAKMFGEQYEKGQVFFKDKWINALNIKEIEIRETYNKSASHYPNLTSSTIFYGSKTDIKVVTRRFIKSPPKKERINELTIGLMKSVAFLGLDIDWSLATSALQLQEVAVILVAKRKKIELNKANVERVLNKKIDSLSFSRQYEAFSRQVGISFGIEMPILATHLRKMRTKVLHEGYNPKPEETDSIVGFTIGLLQKLDAVSRAT